VVVGVGIFWFYEGLKRDQEEEEEEEEEEDRLGKRQGRER
jgi:hypothetical protein